MKTKEELEDAKQELAEMEAEKERYLLREKAVKTLTEFEAGKEKEVIVQVEHKNYRCRACFSVDGYIEEETTCRTCGTPLNLTDFV